MIAFDGPGCALTASWLAKSASAAMDANANEGRVTVIEHVIIAVSPNDDPCP
jgi:hypothetical protein